MLRYSAVVRHVTTTTTMEVPAIPPDPGPQSALDNQLITQDYSLLVDLSHPHRSSPTPINGREREEGEGQGGTDSIPCDSKEKNKDGQVDELEAAAASTAPDQDGDTQHDSGLADSPVSEEIMVARWHLLTYGCMCVFVCCVCDVPAGCRLV